MEWAAQKMVELALLPHRGRAARLKGYANPQSLRVEPCPWRAIYPGVGGFGADAAVDSVGGTRRGICRPVGCAVDGRGDPTPACGPLV